MEQLTEQDIRLLLRTIEHWQSNAADKAAIALAKSAVSEFAGISSERLDAIFDRRQQNITAEAERRNIVGATLKSKLLRLRSHQNTFFISLN